MHITIQFTSANITKHVYFKGNKVHEFEYLNTT